LQNFICLREFLLCFSLNQGRLNHIHSEDKKIRGDNPNDYNCLYKLNSNFVDLKSYCCYSKANIKRRNIPYRFYTYWITEIPDHYTSNNILFKEQFIKVRGKLYNTEYYNPDVDRYYTRNFIVYNYDENLDAYIPLTEKRDLYD